MNLLNETTAELAEHGLTWDDVVWVGTEEVEIPIDHFKKIANKSYDNGWGSPEVATDLVVCGIDWWLERREYDGSEWWEMRRTLKRPNRIVYPHTVTGEGRSTIKGMNHMMEQVFAVTEDTNGQET